MVSQMKVFLSHYLLLLPIVVSFRVMCANESGVGPIYSLHWTAPKRSQWLKLEIIIFPLNAPFVAHSKRLIKTNDFPHATSTNDDKCAPFFFFPWIIPILHVRFSCSMSNKRGNEATISPSPLLPWLNRDLALAYWNDWFMFVSLEQSASLRPSKMYCLRCKSYFISFSLRFSDLNRQFWIREEKNIELQQQSFLKLNKQSFNFCSFRCLWASSTHDSII